MGKRAFCLEIGVRAASRHIGRRCWAAVLGALAWLAGAAPPAVAQQCDAACREQLFRSADQRHNAVYRDLQLKLDAAHKAALRDAQRAWLKRRDLACRFRSSQSDYGLWVRELVQDAQRTQCMIAAIEARTAELARQRDGGARSAQGAAPRQAAPSKDTCEAETAAAERDAPGVTWSITSPRAPKAGDPLRVNWRSDKRFPAGAAVYLVVALPGDVRFDADAVEAKSDRNGMRLPALPGFLALPGGAAAPLDIQFGVDKTRAMIPLHQPGSKLAGAFSVRTFEQGTLTVESALVLRTQCGERLLTPVRRQSFDLVPGAPEIIVQDPYDLEVPPKAFLSGNGRYLLQVFDGRYRVFDVATGLKLADRNGHHPSFSPTSRFVAAEIGDLNGRDFEVVDLVSREVIATPIGRFIGWTEGDAYLIDGRAEYGFMTLRPTLISRAQAPRRKHALGLSWAPELGAMGARDDGLQVEFLGSCHACRSWSDTNMTIDLDRAVVVLSGEQAAPRIFELATGHSECCTSASEVRPYLSRFSPGGSFELVRGWHARTPLRFTHAFDPANEPGGKWWDAVHEKEDWFRIAVKLTSQLYKPRPIDPRMQLRVAAATDRDAGRREDWRTRVRSASLAAGQTVQQQTLQALSAFGVPAMAALEREAAPFSNSEVSEDPRSMERWGNDSDRIQAEIARRTRPYEQRLLAEYPALKQHLSKDATVHDFPGFLKETLPNDLTGTKFNLDSHLEGMWRWELDGRPVWLLQLLTIDGSSASGWGALVLASHTPGGNKAPVHLSAALQGFWHGSYGSSAHQTRIKPQLFPNGYLVAASVSAGTIAVYDVRSRRAKALIGDVPQRDLLQEVTLSADARFVIQINSDGQLFLHRISDGKLALSGRVVDGEVILYTPEGYYWSSYEGAHFVQLRFPGVPGFFTFQQFEAALNRPDIVKARLKGAAPAAPPRLTSPPELSLRTLGAAAGKAGTEVEVQARSSVGLGRLRFYYDGRMVREVAATGMELRERLVLPPAGNARRLTALAADAKGFVSTQSIPLASSGDKRGRLFSVLVGIDRYADPELNLEFARSDASRLDAALREVGPRYYAATDATVLLNENATAQAIAAALEKAVAAAQETDTLVFSFAGHGVPSADGRYFLTPTEFRRTDVTGTGLSWSRLAGILERSKARVLVILDSCHSGLSGAQGLATNDEVVQALMSGARAPMLVLAASKGREFAEEHQDWGGGVFTFALAKVLRDNAYDLDKDGAIEVSELYRGLREIVTRETDGRQSPWLARRDLIGDFALF